MPSHRRLIWPVSAAASLALACSVINAFDDVKPADDASTGIGGSTGGTAGSGGSVTGGGGISGSGGAPTGGGGSSGSGGDGGGAAGADAGVQPGLIVMTGKAKNNNVFNVPALVVLNPQTGVELSRETGTEYAGVVYDRASGLFLLFEIQKPDGGPPQALRIVPRKFDKVNKSWDDAPGTALPGAPLSIPGATEFVGLQERVAYLAQVAVDGGGTGKELVVVNTSNPKALTLATAPLTQDTVIGNVFDIVGSVTASAVGGSLAVIRQNCIAGNCALLLGNISVNAAGISNESPPAGKGNFSPPNASPGWGPVGDPNTISVAVAIPPGPDGGTDATMLRFTGTGFQKSGEKTFAVTGNNRLAPLAFDRCLNVGFVGETTVERIHAVPLTPGGTVSFVDKAFAVQRLIWEPHTRTVLAPFAQSSNTALAAYRLGGTNVAPTLTAATPWSPPTDFQPAGIAVEIDSPSCP
jgi:hypothetical protein